MSIQDVANRLEVNAAIEGFARGGATEFLVADGHGPGAINLKVLDPRAQLARNWASPPYPFSLDKGTILRPRGNQGKQIGRSSHPDDVIALLNGPMKYESLKK